jgi:outer membrane protein assembly factor BamB
MNRLILTLLLSHIFSLALISQEISQWRGPERNGIYPADHLLREWPKDGPELIWHFDELGQGFSSAAVINDAVYTTGMIDETGYVFALDHKGNLLWKSEYGPEWVESYPGSRTTPTVIGDHLYVMSAMGKVVCFNSKTGTKNWSVDLFDKFDARNIRWGMTESLAFDGDLVFCTPGGTDANIVALNRFNGKTVWTSPGKKEKSAYCSPLIIKLPARTILVTMTENHIIGVDVKDGSVLWSHEQTNQWSVHANTPIYHDGEIYCYSGYGRGGVKLKLNNGGTQITKDWRDETLDSRMGGAVLIDAFIYGSGDKNRDWYCLNWDDANMKYASGEIRKGAVIAADGLLFCYSERGEVALAEATPEEFALKGEFRAPYGSDQHWAHPVIHNGRLYVRHGNSMMVYKISK